MYDYIVSLKLKALSRRIWILEAGDTEMVGQATPGPRHHNY